MRFCLQHFIQCNLYWFCFLIACTYNFTLCFFTCYSFTPHSFVHIKGLVILPAINLFKLKGVKRTTLIECFIYFISQFLQVSPNIFCLKLKAIFLRVIGRSKRTEYEFTVKNWEYCIWYPLWLFPNKATFNFINLSTRYLRRKKKKKKKKKISSFWIFPLGSKQQVTIFYLLHLLVSHKQTTCLLSPHSEIPSLVFPVYLPSLREAFNPSSPHNVFKLFYLLHLYFLHPCCSTCFFHFSRMYSALLQLTFIPPLSSSHPHLSRFSYLLSALTTYHNVICQHHRPWRPPSDLIGQLIIGPSTWSLPVTLNTHFTAIMLPSHMSCTNHFSATLDSIEIYLSNTWMKLNISKGTVWRNCMNSQILHFQHFVKSLTNHVVMLYFDICSMGSRSETFCFNTKQHSTPCSYNHCGHCYI